MASRCGKGRYTRGPEFGLGMTETSREFVLGRRLAESLPVGLAFGPDFGGRGARACTTTRSRSTLSGSASSGGFSARGGRTWNSASRLRGSIRSMATGPSTASGSR